MDWINFSRPGLDPSLNALLSYDPNHSCYINLKNMVVPHETVIQESIKVVKHISETRPGPYYLMASGGIDSQSMLYAWKQSKVPFKIISFTYNQTFNEHDLIPLKLFAKQQDLEVEYRDIDHFNFLNTELKTYAEKYICASPHITFYMKFADTIKDGTVIFSGEPILSAGLTTNYSQLGLYRYEKFSGRSIVPYFFLYSPSFSKAWYDHILDIMELNKEFNLTSYSLRAFAYMTAGFPIIPTKKLTGFENYKLFFDRHPELITLQDNLKYRKKPHVYDILYRFPLYDIHKIKETIIHDPTMAEFYNICKYEGL